MPETLSSVALNPVNVSVSVGHTTNFTAIGTYTDGTTANITSRVTWTTDNTNVATINNTTGVATGVAVGIGC